MRLITISKILLIFALPLLIFLFATGFVAFSGSFYQEKFSEYGVQKDVPEAALLHQRVMEFLKGTSNDLPPDFNEREKQHLLDVKKIADISTVLLYILLALFVILLAASAFMLKISHYIMRFIGKVLLFGGLLAVILASALLFFINSDFASSFESFHSMLFQKGTYTFEPARETIVRLYPEQLFMDLGISISKWAAIISASIILLGLMLIIKSKTINNKKNFKL